MKELFGNSRKRNRSYAAAGLLGLLLATQACEDHPTASGRVTPSTIRRNTPTYSASIPVDPVTGRGSVEVATFDTLTYVEITVNGTVREIPSSGPVAHEWGPTGYFWASASTYDCVMPVDLVSDAGAFDAPGPCTGRLSDGTLNIVHSYTTRLRVLGTLRAIRPGPLPSVGGSYEGQQTITVRPIKAGLNVIADRSTIEAGDTVRYTVKFETDASSSQWSVGWWRWRKASGTSYTWAGSYGQTSHSGPMTETGWTVVEGTIDGQATKDSVLITVKEPPQWKITTNKVSYEPNETATYVLEFVGGDTTKWYPRTSVNGWWSIYAASITPQGWQGKRRGSEQVTIAKTVAVDGVTASYGREAKKRIRVIKCAKQDSVLDDQRLRDSIAALERDAAKAKREIVAMAFFDPSTGGVTFRRFTSAGGRCFVDLLTAWNSLTSEERQRLLAVIHPHPFRFYEVLPQDCWEDPAVPERFGEGTVYGGFSSADVQAFLGMLIPSVEQICDPELGCGPASNRLPDMYTMNGGWLWRLPFDPKVDQGSRDTLHRGQIRYRRAQTQCVDKSHILVPKIY